MGPPRYRRVVLETSLKPFADPRPEAVPQACRTLWTNWARLIERAEEVCVLLWVGEGSDLFEWRGDPDEPIVWAQSIGFCNTDRPGAYPPDNRHYRLNRAVPFRRDLPVIRYRDLREIIRRLRATADETLGRPILVGATVDPGPEFADSPFRFEKHPELLAPGGGAAMGMMHFLTHQARLAEDPTPYAAFPEGIPAGTSFGTFLGRQFDAARRDLGFDYLWLSNGLGYTHYPWGFRGELFDGERFDGERAGAERDKARRFWADLRRACPDAPFEVRGTNFSVAMDLASDGCSHADIFALGRLQRPPCNPPWGSRALGLEMTSYLSRLAKAPTDRLPVRFYLNDPWFVANPWYDYYAGETYDLYVPMSAARLNDAGRAETPTDLSLLTVDTETGALPPDEAGQVIPHLLRALDERADAAGPVVWVYPFDEYHALLERAPQKLPVAFAHDWFVCRAVGAGLPLNTVVSSDRFAALAAAGRLPEAVYFAPAAAGEWACQQSLLAHVAAGGKALLYGPLEGAPPALLEALGLALADEPLEGDFNVEVRLTEDRFARAPSPPVGSDAAGEAVGDPGAGTQGKRARAGETRPLRHRALISGGGLRAAADPDDPGVRVLLRRGRQRRVYAVSRAPADWHGGRLAWIRGSCCFDPTCRGLEPAWDPPWQVCLPDDWPRRMLADFGLDIVQERRDAAVRPANVFLKRRAGAWVFVGHKPDTSVRFHVRTADGAPAYAERETPIADGYAGEGFGKSFHREVRAFVKMRDGIVGVKALPVPIGARRHFAISGLAGATVTLYPSPAALVDGSLRLTSVIQGEQAVPSRTDRARATATVADYTGTLYVLW